VRLWDRLLSRADDGYGEWMYTGAYQVPVTDSSGREREGAAAGIVRAAREAYECNGVVFACSLVRSALFSEARFKFQATSDDHLFGNTGLAVLEHPWPGATQGELLARLDQDETTAGNCYVRRAVPADGTGALLVQMRPDCVTIISEEAPDTMGRVFRRPVGYAEDLRPQGIYDRDPQIYSTAEVCHYSPVPDPKARFRGMSWLTPVLREVGADQAMTTYKTEHLRSGAQLGIVVKYAQKLQAATIDSLRERITARYGGPQNAGKTLVLDQGADVTVAGSTLEQLQFEAVQRAGERRVCAAAGPGLLEILGFERGDYQAAIRKLADLWARPRWRQACASLEHLVPTAGLGGVRLWFDVAGIAALREGELQRGQTTLVKAQAVETFVASGYTRETAILAAESGDLTQLEPDPAAPAGVVAGRRPQAARPEALPGTVKPNLPNALPGGAVPMPALPNGARG
jgi:phage portal protein BeeE